MPHDDDGNEPDPQTKRLLDVSDDLSARSAQAIRRADRAVRGIKRLLSDNAALTPGATPQMEWAITQEDEPGLIVVRVRGSFTVAGCRAVAGEVAASKDPLCPVLIDKRDVEVARITTSDLIEAESALRDHIYAFTFCRMGLLVHDGPPREIAESWSRLASTSTNSRIAVFTDEPAAREWLAEN